MNKVNLPEIGDRIEIETSDYMNGVSKKNLVSQIMDMLDEKIYFVAMPIVNNAIKPIPWGEIIKVKYAKKDLGVYVFKAKVIGRKNVENISYMKIERIEAITKTQRRSFFRLEALLDVFINFRDEALGENRTITSLAKDISGGGTRLISKERLKLNSIVTLTINTKKEAIVVEGKVVRCVPFQITDFDVGVIFEDIDEAVRTKIISFIFEEQRKMRKKGLI